MNKLEVTFNLAGWSAEVMKLLARDEVPHQMFTAYGLIRNRSDSTALQCIATMHGRLGRVNPTAFSKGNLMHHEYSIKSIVFYSLFMQTIYGTNLEEIYYWDFFTSVRRVGGIDLNRQMVQLLGIPANPIDSTNSAPIA
jgi:hypothetical protein